MRLMNDNFTDYNDRARVSIPIGLLKDLILMARHSDQYREGFAWTAISMNRATQLYSRALATMADDCHLRLVAEE